MFDIDDRGNVVDIYFGEEQCAKINREATVNGVPDQTEFYVFYETDGLREFLIEKGYGDEITNQVPY